MNNQIQAIISFWRKKFQDADSDKQEKLKELVTVVRENMDVGLWYPEEDEWFWYQDNWYIYGEHKEHFFMICQDYVECSCHSYQCSGEGLQNKKPCKHLYALASGVITNWATTTRKKTND